ncbi:GAF domain-containing protein [Robbsia sp. KACC 23696]|uniref:GAF domain-containing protein n=1 Tax=Robbsia sp. KACC 23696 TaxID=3149231 RepID=UPI00325BBC2E
MQNGLTDVVANCDQEPIHALGSVQPHGALLCFDDAGRLIAASATAAQFLGELPPLGAGFSERHFSADARQLLSQALADRQALLEPVEVSGQAGTRFDLILHWSNSVLIAEWEAIDDVPLGAAHSGHYAALAQRAIQRLQRTDYDSVSALMQDAVEAVRSMTGFDRVMGYRFLQDDSGEVIAEARRDDLSSFLHQRYPAGDIPAQARRLYTLQAIRQIMSVDAISVPIVPSQHPRSGQAFDLSQAVLRSVSPIHIEYLKNMGVAASMSISIVINGRLWGLIACHHMQAHRAPLAVRLSCTVLTQVLSILIERIEFKRRMSAEVSWNALSLEIANLMADAPDLAAGIAAAGDAIGKMVDCDGLSVVVDQRVLLLSESASRQGMLELADHMADQRLDTVVARSMSKSTPDLPRPLTRNGVAAGLMAIQVVSEARITVAWLRDELVETIRWAGPPDKIVALGPHGRRLTPRGSFEVWQQTVRGSCREWSDTDQSAARAVKAVLQDVALERLRESDRERMTLLATLGHDLRDPLQAINLAVQLMGKGLATSTDTAKRVEGSTRRMQSLISYILDVSRIRSGIGLSLTRRPTSLDAVLSTLVEEMRFNYPGSDVQLDSDALGEAELDEDRFVQGMTNLLSNARQHGDPSAPIVIVARADGVHRRIEVRNKTTQRVNVPFRRLIDPFKGGPLNLNNRSGLGLGLFIANAIFTGHGGAFDAVFEEQQARFIVTL